MSLRVLVFLLVTWLILSNSTADPGENETDYFALLAFKETLHNPQEVLSSWNHSIHFCNWEGVTCGRLHKRVTILNLKSTGLSGFLSPHVGNLSFLKELNLQDNNFQREIPNEISRLFRLQSLSLQNNSFDGEIPANLSFCTSLKILNVSRNNLVGEIPRGVYSLPKLTALVISRNNISGEIPSFIRNLSSLETFDVSYNLFKGSIPTTLGDLQNLTHFRINGNKISGMVPLSMYNLSSLAILMLSDNEFTGTLPQDLGLTLPRIQTLRIKGNYFNGTIPLSLSNASKLSNIDFSYNYFTGKLPNFGTLKNLSTFAVFDNELGSTEGDDMTMLIDQLTNCSSLVFLSVDVNRLRGTIPKSVANLSSRLREFGVAVNRFHGVIPLGLGNLENLERIQMGDNQFEGQIPDDIGKLRKLTKLHLFTNKLSGQIPPFLGNMSLLSLVYLDDNLLEGTIPSSIGNCKNLIWLDLSRNSLYGTIPIELFDASSLSISLDLSNNHLFGQIPFEVGKLRNLAQIDLSRNELSGEIPTELRSCNSLVDLYLESNHLNGSIPLAVRSLTGLQNLDLSSNNLSGMIPKFLENLSMKSLNLSFNYFTGELPTQGIFANASAISIDGNSGLCGGILDLRLPECKSETRKRKRLSHLLIATIVLACLILATSIVSLFILWLRRNNKREQPSESSAKGSFLKVSYADLAKATSGFSSSNIIGKGSFGSVYKGILDHDEMIVAVKVLNLERYGASKSFAAECNALRNIRHRNLLKVITSCSSIDSNGDAFKALVYEYMPNGSLDRWLNSDQENLNLGQRIDVAADVAFALDYLHHQCEKPIIHCDLKPSNVLLDENMVAHVGDFGLAKFVILEFSDEDHTQSAAVRGTVGYAAPEYGLGNEVTASGDIYSYGIMLLEMMTGKSPVDPIFSEGLNLHNYSEAILQNNVMDIVDPKLLFNEDKYVTHAESKIMRKDTIMTVVKIGVACSMESPQDRMSLNDVIHQLLWIKSTLGGQ